jgi:hypothetical protein
LLGAAVAAFIALASPVPLPAQQQHAREPRIDRRLGEEEQIRAREEWFLSTRRPGTTSPAERAALRLDAVHATRAALERQRLLRQAGLKALDNQWVSKGPSPSTFGGWAFGNVAGRVSSIAADWTTNTLYLGTASGGVWTSSNDGLSWFPIFDTAGTMTVGAVTVVPGSPPTLWVGTGENHRSCEAYFGIGLLRSTDGGQTWETRNGAGASSLEDLASFASVVVDPRNGNHVVTGGRLRDCVNGNGFAGGIYTTNDAGATWTNRLAATEVYEIAQDPAVLDVFWAATRSGIYKSQDNAVTWVLQTASGLPTGVVGRAEVAIAPSNSSVVYAYFEGPPASFWRTTNGGASWTQMASGSNACDGQCWYNAVVRVDPTNPSIVYRGTVHVFKSTNGGSSWSDLSRNWGSSQKVHQDTHDLLIRPGFPGTIYVGSDGGIWKTTDGGSSFTNRNGDLSITQFYAIGVSAHDSDMICGGAQDNSSLARTASNVWDLQEVTGDGMICHYDPVNPGYAYITSYPSGGFPSVFRSATGPFGDYFWITGSGSGIIQNDRVNFVTPYLLDPVDPATLFLGTHRVYRSTNRGSLWTQVGPTDMTGGAGQLLSLELNRNYRTVVYAGSARGNVYRTVNRGDTWTDISTGLPVRPVNDIAADPSDPDRALVALGGFNTAHLWQWTASGGFAPTGAGLPNVPANTVLMLTSVEVLVGTDTGVFISRDGGATFEPYMLGLPEGLVVMDLEYDEADRLVTAGTYGRGAWQVTVGTAVAAVAFDSIALPPAEVDGDGDANVEPGETWSVRVLLRNSGGLQANGVQARLATASPGVTLVGPTTRSFGNLGPGAAGEPPEPFAFVVDPAAACGQSLSFDVLDITSAIPAATYPGAPGAFTLTILDHDLPPTPTPVLEEDFDPQPSGGWTHEAVAPTIEGCDPAGFIDQWGFASQDATHGESFHCGLGPGTHYGRQLFAWLHAGGRDSLQDPGIVLPADITAAELSFEQWYETTPGRGGGVVLIDAVEDDQDVYVPLEPNGGYPAGELGGLCNALTGMEAFHGSSNGWTSASFDLLPYLGRRVYLALVFGSANEAGGGEGWYIDDVTVTTWSGSGPVCDTAGWPGTVPPDLALYLAAPDTIEAEWGDSCNAGAVPGQTYSILVGDLDLLASGGGYAHAPVDGRCDLVSPAMFAPGPGNEYYLVVPTLGDRVGGAGNDSFGVPRPVGSACGLEREAACN